MDDLVWKNDAKLKEGTRIILFYMLVFGKKSLMIIGSKKQKNNILEALKGFSRANTRKENLNKTRTD